MHGPGMAVVGWLGLNRVPNDPGYRARATGSGGKPAPSGLRGGAGQ